MKLKNQVTRGLLGVFGLFMLAGLSVQLLVNFPTYRELERDLAIADIERVAAAIDREVEALDKIVFEWSDWDDTYSFAENRNPEFVHTNLSAKSYFEQGHLPVCLILDRSGQIVFESFRDPVTFDPWVTELKHDEVWKSHSIAGQESHESMSGVVVTIEGPMIFSSRPILRSDSTGPPQGRMIMARFLDQEKVTALSSQTRVSFELLLGSQARELVADAGLQPTMRERSEDVLEVARRIPTLRPQDDIVAVATVERAVTARGRETMLSGMVLMIVSAAGAVGALLWLLQSRVVSPISKLKHHVAEVGATGDLMSQVHLDAQNEIGELGEAFNTMVSRLAESQKSLATMSRRAGMADVASSVLHNIGNTMNSALVTISTLSSRVNELRVESLSKALEIMPIEAERLATFLTTDSRGRQFPIFLRKVTDSLQDDRECLALEVQRLQTCLDHIHEIIRDQQDLAKGPEATENCLLGDVIDSALTVVRPSFERHGVALTLQPVAKLRGHFQKAKLQQVLVNLLTNAKQAVQDQPPERRRVEVMTEVIGPLASIRIRDEGVGFTEFESQSLFTQGFTTKHNGHGIGLHFCALAVAQMKGSIESFSLGREQGATFTVRVPVEPIEAEMRVAA